MYMRFEMTTLCGAGTLEASGVYRYLLLLSGGGEFTAPGAGGRFQAAVHDVLAVPQHRELRYHCPSPTLLGCIEMSDMVTSQTYMYLLPGAHTALLRQLFFLALDIQDVDLPYYDTLRSGMHQVIHSALMAAGLAAERINPAVVVVLREIISRFTDPEFDLAEAIHRTGYTVNHFRKLFRDETGLPPLEFLNNRRLEYAKELFSRREGELTVAEVAHRCGFRDEYYFARYFKKREGVTPAQYQQAVWGGTYAIPAGERDPELPE